MGLYNRYLLPKLTHLTCSVSTVSKQRLKVVPFAKGKVLEVGFGTGLNMPFYDPSIVTELWALEPSKAMLDISKKSLLNPVFPIEFLQTGAEDIPLEINSIDTVVLTYTLCSIQKESLALAEIRRVLKPGGMLLFCEHGLAPDGSVSRWQNRLDPIWVRLSGGCHLNKDIPDYIQSNGFSINQLDSMYIPGWKPACFNYWGSARIR